ncbi:MAG TPA: Re/Si-specific NAD(P)(+) transhydrogenase subunit alpha [Chloroflexia bacterium]|nr:Re/Si-specific NAD(P)(+) transhydrogenase subunit alpha [Chloroflexia bacterium]
MRIGIPRETMPGETRVACTPAIVSELKKDNHELLVESGAGLGASFSDAQYRQAGARIIEDSSSLYAQADIVLKVQPPCTILTGDQPEIGMLRQGTSYIGLLSPYNNLALIETLARNKVNCYAMEFIPRLARTQNMDALSSMATIAGYKAVLIAAARSGKLFPLMMTAAGTIYPATVLVLGAGVAGLQAIATAHRLGAKVAAFDPRPVVKEQVNSLGASFIEMPLSAEVETKGGYAAEQSAAFLKAEMDTISAHLPKVDVVITTAQVFGKAAPRLISAGMVELMPPGAIIVDLAAEQGGNCELTQPGQTIEYHGVTIIGATNLPATVPVDASQLYARNVFNLFRYLFPPGKPVPDLSDEIVSATCVTFDGAVVNENLKELVRQGVTA